MIELEDLYFEWLLKQLDPDGVREGVVYVCSLLHNCAFHRRVGRDVNRAIDGINMRKDFLAQVPKSKYSQRVRDDLEEQECTWLEMMIALSVALDYYYEGGVEGRFVELATNMQLDTLMRFEAHRSEQMEEYDQRFVETATTDIDKNRFDRDGHGGMFPLRKAKHPDQREVEIWDQHSAYFSERLEGVLWTSTS